MQGTQKKQTARLDRLPDIITPLRKRGFSHESHMKDESIRATTVKAPILLMVSTMISFMILDN